MLRAQRKALLSQAVATVLEKPTALVVPSPQNTAGPSEQGPSIPVVDLTIDDFPLENITAENLLDEAYEPISEVELRELAEQRSTSPVLSRLQNLQPDIDYHIENQTRITKIFIELEHYVRSAFSN